MVRKGERERKEGKGSDDEGPAGDKLRPEVWRRWEEPRDCLETHGRRTLIRRLGVLSQVVDEVGGGQDGEAGQEHERRRRQHRAWPAPRPELHRPA